MTDINEPTRSGYVAVVGKPNVGKSTLMNALMGQKIAAVSPRPQTTRKRQMGILTTDQMQIIFIDTPGMHHPHHKLGEFMNQESEEALKDADIILFMVDGSKLPDEEDLMLAEKINNIRKPPPILQILNKYDLIPHEELAARQVAFQEIVPQAFLLPLSATTGYNLDRLLKELHQRLPSGEAFYSEEQITDLSERDIAADLIREAALIHLRDEIPHCIAVRIDEFTERGETGAYITATLFVERESQKPIVIGKNGMMLKKIGVSARQEIESMSGRKVFLELRVKVLKNWRQDDNALKNFGLTTERKR
jgi:GTP-binding protein Era